MIRPATPADVAAVQDLVRAAYEHYIPRIGRPPYPMVADYGALIGAGQVGVALSGPAGQSGAVVDGVLVLVPERDHVLVETVAVAPSAQGRGRGTALLAFAEDRARELGLPEVRLYTNEAMTENIAYYPRRGYTETQRSLDQGYRRVFFSKRVRV